MLMTKNDIEFIVDATRNRLDEQLVNGQISQMAYDAEIAKLNEWATMQQGNVPRDFG